MSTDYNVLNRSPWIRASDISDPTPRPIGGLGSYLGSSYDWNPSDYSMVADEPYYDAGSGAPSPSATPNWQKATRSALGMPGRAIGAVTGFVDENVLTPIAKPIADAFGIDTGGMGGVFDLGGLSEGRRGDGGTRVDRRVAPRKADMSWIKGPGQYQKASPHAWSGCNPYEFMNYYTKG